MPMQDIVQVIRILLERMQHGQEAHGVFNMGGPDRLSRLDMAHQVGMQLTNAAADPLPWFYQ